MKNPIKVKSNMEDLELNVMASATIASAHIANGRNIPVVFVEADEIGKMENIINVHETIKEGSCESLWGITKDKKNAVLIIDFKEPVEQRVILIFDIIKFGIVVNQILYAQCLLLMIGGENSKISLCLDSKRIFVEVPVDEFKPIWEKIFRKKYAKYLKKKHNLSRKASYEIFDKMIEEFEIVKTIRM